MSFIPAAHVSDFATATRKTLSIMGKRLLLMKAEDGSFRCIEIQCKHQGADLSQGKWEGTVVTCPRHGWRYDIASGECLNTNPANSASTKCAWRATGSWSESNRWWRIRAHDQYREEAYEGGDDGSCGNADGVLLRPRQ